MSSQLNLFAVADHSNMGKAWERELETLHDFYRLQSSADIVKNAEKWIYIGNAEYDRLFAADPGLVARDGHKRAMKRTASDVDFSGGGYNPKTGTTFAIVFDAKCTAADRLALSMLKEHQIYRLRQSHKCRCLAGFLVLMAKFDRVFWLPYGVAERKFTDYKKQTGKRAAPGSASFTMNELESSCIEIRKNKTNGCFDWLAVIVS